MERVPAVEINSLCKNYAGIHALKDVSLTVMPNEIHSICGENGAGKSTFIKILAGVVEKNSGTIKVFGKEMQNGGPKDSLALGINVVYQEFSLVENLSIAENIYLHSFRNYINKLGYVNQRRLYSDGQKLLEKLQFNFDSRQMVSSLSTSEKQLIEIAKALSQDSKILILDEPTAVLSSNESDVLFDTIFKLKNKGVTIIYISHRLSELFKLSDNISIFRDGSHVLTSSRKSLTEETLVYHMIGKKSAGKIARTDNTVVSEKIVLSIKNVSSNNGLKRASLDLHKGEVIGIAGIIGSGRTELARVIFGVDKMESGKYIFDGRKVAPGKVSDAISLGIGLIPESRKDQGLILGMSICENIILPSQKENLRLALFLNKKKEIDAVNSIGSRLQVKGAHWMFVRNLSGGNQQKVVIAKWMLQNLRVLIFDEPTRGIDVGTKSEIYKLIKDFCGNFGSVIMISSELEEIINLSDRVYVMNKGVLSSPLTGEDINEEKIMSLAIS